MTKADGLHQRLRSEQVVPLNTVEELWDNLRPELLSGSYRYIYRGHSNSDWLLQPSIDRLSNKKVMYFGGDCNEYSMRVHEMTALNQFYKNCHRQGLSIPGYDSFPSSLFEEYDLRGEWPTKQVLNVMAVSQHHGFATHLLDWSRSPLVSIYFAANEAMHTIFKAKSEHLTNTLENQRIAVWRFNYHAKVNRSNLKIHIAKGTVSTNLEAQLGLFTYIEKQFGVEGESLEEIFARNMEYDCKVFTLPITECLHALELCSIYNIDTVKMFPGFDGAAKYSIEKGINQRVEEKIFNYISSVN